MARSCALLPLATPQLPREPLLACLPIVDLWRQRLSRPRYKPRCQQYVHEARYVYETSGLIPSFQMAARSSQGPNNSIDATTNAFRNATLSDKPLHPALRSAVSAPSAPGRPPSNPALGGLAKRRAGLNAPKLNVNEIAGGMGLHLPPGGGPSGAGLGGGRPMMDDLPRRSPQATWGTPFANFSKIVSVSLILSLSL